MSPKKWKFWKTIGISFSNFRKIAWVENYKISFFGSVFHVEKYGGKILRKFEFFGFLRNSVWDKSLCIDFRSVRDKLPVNFLDHKLRLIQFGFCCEFYFSRGHLRFLFSRFIYHCRGSIEKTFRNKTSSPRIFSHGSWARSKNIFRTCELVWFRNGNDLYHCPQKSRIRKVFNSRFLLASQSQR